MQNVRRLLALLEGGSRYETNTLKVRTDDLEGYA